MIEEASVTTKRVRIQFAIIIVLTLVSSVYFIAQAAVAMQPPAWCTDRKSVV